MSALKIRKDDCELDFLALGALVHRLDPGVIPFRKARSFEIHVSGGEYNVAANLSDCFGLRTGVATAMVNYPHRRAGARPGARDGCHAVLQVVRARRRARAEHRHGLQRPRATACAPPVVFYNRANEAGALLKPGDFDWAEHLRPGRPLVPLGRHLRRALRDDLGADHRGDAGREGRRRDHLVRPELPGQALGRRSAAPSEGQQVIRRDRQQRRRPDRQRGRPAKGPGHRRPRGRTAKSKLDPDTFFKLIDRVVEQHPNIKLVATTLREVHSTNRHDWAAVLWLDGKRYVSPTCQLDVIDRIGGGDGFAAGLIYGLLSGRSPEEALRLGWAHGALLTTFPGDVTMARLDEVEALAKGGSARVQR